MDKIYKGMTVNERLFVSGLLDDFDAAVEEKNSDKVVEILKKVEITEVVQINPILKSVGLAEISIQGISPENQLKMGKAFIRQKIFRIF